MFNHISIAGSQSACLSANFSKGNDFGWKGQAHNWAFDGIECVYIYKSNEVQTISLLLLPQTLGEIFYYNKSIVEIKNFRSHF